VAFTFDPTTERGQVRLIIGDDVEATAVFTDAKIDAFLTMEGSVKRAAAAALDRLATSEAYIQKVLKVGDLTTNGAATAKAIREHAALLREQDESEPAFDFAEMAVTDFAAREILLNDALRER
jgi:hypothetical protein